MKIETLAQLGQVATGVGSLWVSWIALRASRRISEQQQKIAVNSNRAYLVWSSPVITKFDVKDPVQYSIDLKNWGQTPAMRTRVQFRSYLAEKTLGDGLRIDSDKAEAILPPQTKMVLTNPKEVVHISKSEYSKLQSGHLTFFVDAIAEYYDLSGGCHETFCRFFLPKENIGGAMPLPMSFGKGSLSST